MTMRAIARVELTSATQFFQFSSIPANFTDLMILTSFRSASANGEDTFIQFNGDTAGNYQMRRLYGAGSGAGTSDSVSGTATAARVSRVVGGNYTANVFSNDSIYIPNYLSSTSKNVSVDTVEENNATFAYAMIYGTLWTGTAPITSLRIGILSGVNFAAGSSATLYGILRGSDGITTVS